MGNALALFRVRAQHENERVGLNVAISSAPRANTRRRVLPAERHAIALLFEHRCASCRVLLPAGWQLDHRVALADGGPDDAANMQPLCSHCHTLKTARENSTRTRPLLGKKRAKRRKLAKGAVDVKGPAVAPLVDVMRVIVLTAKCAAHFKTWRERNESFRVDRYMRISGKTMAMLLASKTMVQKRRNEEVLTPYGVRDLKHDLTCGFVQLGVTLSA
jgi:hypothetical protein